MFCKPTAVAPALVRRDGRVQVAGHPADHARLGILEQQLDEMTGQPDVIGQVAARTVLQGKVKGAVRRSMTVAAAIRASLVVTVMPDADYPEILACLFGDLAAVPWQRRFTVPTATVLSAWREAAGAGPLEQLQGMVLAASAAEHEARDYRAVDVGDLALRSVDGSVTRMPDTAANRARYGAATSDHDRGEEMGTITMVDGSHTRKQLGADDATTLHFAQPDRHELEKMLVNNAVYNNTEIHKVKMVIPKGHMSFHHCRTYHGSGHNRSNQARRANSLHLQDRSNHWRPFRISSGELVVSNNDVLVRRTPQGHPDYADPDFCPVLWDGQAS